MALFSKKRQVFVVRIWREARELKDKLPEWRGEIECVNSGQRRYLKNLDEIVAFIAPYLTEMGVKLEMRWRIKRWFSRRQGVSPEPGTAAEAVDQEHP